MGLLTIFMDSCHSSHFIFSLTIFRHELCVLAHLFHGQCTGNYFCFPFFFCHALSYTYSYVSHIYIPQFIVLWFSYRFHHMTLTCSSKISDVNDKYFFQPGFLWSFNYMLTRRWKSVVSGDEILGEKMLHDFRQFCTNHHGRLRDFWDSHLPQLSPVLPADELTGESWAVYGEHFFSKVLWVIPKYLCGKCISHCTWNLSEAAFINFLLLLKRWNYCSIQYKILIFHIFSKLCI